MHNFLASQPDLNFHNPDVQDALLETVRFWLERGVDGFRLDTVNYYFHDRCCADNPPLPSVAATDIPDTNPYGYQEHLYDKTQPENLGFPQAVPGAARRAMAAAPPSARSATTAAIAETVAAYTEGGDKLHMCYTFDLLGPQFSAAHVRDCVDAFETEVVDGWVCWAFSNHDVVRHVSRWTRPGGDADAVAKFSIALLASLRGSICLYQGEELGLQEAELAFEDLRDPYGIRFWPGYKGRDGCRTPMVWEAGRPTMPASRPASRGCRSRKTIGPRSRRPDSGRGVSARWLPGHACVAKATSGAGARLDPLSRCRGRRPGLHPRRRRRDAALRLQFR